MAKPKQQEPDRNPALIELRRVLADRIAGHALSAGEHSTSVPGLTLYRRISPSPCHRGSYEPSLNVFAQGRKRINLGGTEYLCDGSSFLVSSIDIPVQSQIVEASEDVPLLSMLLRLDMPMVGEVLSREDLPEPQGSSHRSRAGSWCYDDWTARRLHQTHRDPRYARGHPVFEPTDSARNHLSRAQN